MCSPESAKPGRWRRLRGVLECPICVLGGSYRKCIGSTQSLLWSCSVAERQRGGAKLTPAGEKTLLLYRRMESEALAATEPAWKEFCRLLKKSPGKPGMREDKRRTAGLRRRRARALVRQNYRKIEALSELHVRILYRMRNNSLSNTAARALAIAVIAGLAAGCASGPSGSGGTAALPDSGAVQGRDLGRGGATSGGLSSVDPSGNAADYSVYDARQMQKQ